VNWKIIRNITLALVLCVSAAEAKTYVVKKNDSLWKVARHVYSLKKNADIDKAWRKIARANGLTNPNSIRAGQKLDIPDINSKERMKAPAGYEYAFTSRTKTTAYCKCRVCCGTSANGRTSIGDRARIINGVAADPRAIPYRSKVYIEGVGFKEVDDTGSAMRRSWRRGIYHLDIRFSSHSQAKRYGTKWIDVVYFHKKKETEIRIASK